MEKLKNLSLKNTIILYTAVSLLCTFLLSAAVIRTAEQVQNKIWWKYVDEDEYFDMAEYGSIRYMVNAPRPAAEEMTAFDHAVSELCDFLQTFSILILSISGSCAAVGLFYKNKLKTPLRELEQASRNITDNNLDFHITYENKDEMGHLCREFERMREQLFKNNQELWHTLEEEKTLRAAIAHDIRSPLSVLKGYQEMLMEYLPDETIDRRRAMEMLSAGMKQLNRMDRFVETMRKMSSLDRRVMRSDPITAEELWQDLSPALDILGREAGKQTLLTLPPSDGQTFCGDREVILEVAENLLSNALRYAKERVEVRIQCSETELRITISDDGSGFGTDPDGLTKAFCQQNTKDSLKHAGLGMYISRLYCEKHGGRLLLENNETNGARVTAIFHRIA